MAHTSSQYNILDPKTTEEEPEEQEEAAQAKGIIEQYEILRTWKDLFFGLVLHCVIMFIWLFFRFQKQFRATYVRVVTDIFIEAENEGSSKDEQTHVLSTMLFLPRGLPNRLPIRTVLIRNAYPNNVYAVIGYLLSMWGHNVVLQEVQGRGNSTGHWDAVNEKSDAKITLQWISRQKWFNAEAGVVAAGMSYNGMTAWATADADQ